MSRLKGAFVAYCDFWLDHQILWRHIWLQAGVYYLVFVLPLSLVVGYGVWLLKVWITGVP